MHSLKTIHDARRTRAIPSQSRLQHHGAFLPLRSPSGSPVFGGTTRFPPAPPGPHLRATGRQGRQLAPTSCTGAKEEQKRGGGKAKDREAKAGSPLVGAVLQPVASNEEEKEGGEREEEALGKAEAARVGREGDKRPEPIRIDSNGFEFVPHVGALSPLEENPTNLASSHLEEDDWELLGLDEEDAVKLGYRLTLEDQKSWGSVMISPVAA
ncbi:hypothetical protein JCM11251_007494 [Rhodosporidiobolus azoricus]